MDRRVERLACIWVECGPETKEVDGQEVLPGIRIVIPG